MRGSFRRNERIMKSFLRRLALMLGNVVTGLSVLAPTAMLADMASGLHVGICDIGLLVTYGAVVLCIGSPLIAWLTAHVDRRVLLASSAGLVAIGMLVSESQIFVRPLRCSTLPAE